MRFIAFYRKRTGKVVVFHTIFHYIYLQTDFKTGKERR